MSIHISSNPGEIAETALLPGDPYRAKWAAETFLENPKLVNETRGMLGYTGEWKGNPVTIQGSGMGMPSLSIYVNELIRHHGVNRLVRIGSAGAMQESVKLRDIVIAMTSSTISTPSSEIFRELKFAPCADWSLLSRAAKAAEAKSAAAHIGGIYSSDTFYDERPDLTKELTRHGALAVEMETAELYTLAARYQKQALSILTISDHLLTGDKLDSADREKTFGDMVEIALEACFP